MNYYLVVWDNLGLEAVVDLSDYINQTSLFQVIDNPNKKNNTFNPIEYYQLRARINMHRNYNIYSISTDDSISQEDIVGLFGKTKKSLKLAIKLIKEKGTKLF